MISHNKTRLTLKAALEQQKETGYTIRYPMSDFRHAIFKCTDKCRGLIDCSWEFNTVDKLTICNLFFARVKVECTYDYKKGSIEVSRYDLLKVDDEPREVLTQIITTTCEALPGCVLSFQPRMVVKIAKKNKEVK